MPDTRSHTGRSRHRPHQGRLTLSAVMRHAAGIPDGTDVYTQTNPERRTVALTAAGPLTDELADVLDGLCSPSPGGPLRPGPVDATGRTSVFGVWAAGNATDPRAEALGSAGAGNAASIAINADLVTQDVDRTMDTHSGAGAVFSAALEAWPTTTVLSDRRYWFRPPA